MPALAWQGPQPSYKAVYEDEEKHIANLIAGEVDVGAEDYSHDFWYLNKRLQTRDVIRTYKSLAEFSDWMWKFLANDEWIIDFAFAIVDAPERYRLPFLKELQRRNSTLHEKSLGLIHKIQTECVDRMRWFSIVATGLEPEHWVCTWCHKQWCKDENQIGLSMKFNTCGRHIYHSDCVDKARENFKVEGSALDNIPCACQPRQYNIGGGLEASNRYREERNRVQSSR